MGSVHLADYRGVRHLVQLRRSLLYFLPGGPKTAPRPPLGLIFLEFGGVPLDFIATLSSDIGRISFVFVVGRGPASFRLTGSVCEGVFLVSSALCLSAMESGHSRRSEAIVSRSHSR